MGVLAGKSGQEKLGIIPCGTGVIPRLIGVPGQSGAYMLSEELILHFLPKVFSGYRVVSKSLIRVTRNADIDADALYDEDLDYREFMAKLIKRRRRLAPVRLELSRELDGDIVKTLCAYTDVKQDAVFRCRSPLDLSFLFQIQDILRQRTELFFEKRFPQRSAQFRPGCPMIPQIREGDKLLSYPYESMKPFLDFLQEAASDPNVVSIKMTLYRVARHSKIIESLIEAAENGKSVLALVELKARFDEENNIEWSRRLEEAGCQVIYGLDGFKVHSKLCLVTRRENGKTEYFTQIGTGNYNEKTAWLYTDLSLMTADSAIGLEAAAVFQALAKGETVEESQQLLVAPKCLQNRILDMIDEEINAARLYRRENQLPDGQGNHRPPDCRLPGGSENRPDCPGHLLPAARCPAAALSDGSVWRADGYGQPLRRPGRLSASENPACPAGQFLIPKKQLIFRISNDSVSFFLPDGIADEKMAVPLLRMKRDGFCYPYGMLGKRILGNLRINPLPPKG